MVIRKNMLVWFHNFSDGALDSIKSFTTKARQTIRVKGYTKKLIRLDDVVQWMIMKRMFEYIYVSLILILIYLEKLHANSWTWLEHHTLQLEIIVARWRNNTSADVDNLSFTRALLSWLRLDITWAPYITNRNYCSKMNK